MARYVSLGLLFCLACGRGPEPEHLLWSADAQSLDNPFPDVRLLTASGGAELRADYYRPFLMKKAQTAKARTLFELYATNARTDVNGFGNFAPTLLRSSAPLDPASLPGHFARLRKTASGYEVLEASLVAEHSSSTLEGTDKTPADDFPEFVFVRVGAPLPEGEEGLLVVTKGLKTTAGVELGRGFAWADSSPELATVAAALGVAESDVLLTLPLKASGVSAAYRTLAEWTQTPAGLAAVTVPPKGMVDDGMGQRPVGNWQSTDPDWNVMTRWVKSGGHVSRVVLGSIAARDPRENGAWKKEWVDDPSQAPVVAMPFVLSVPSGAKPAGGWPIVMVAHGVNGRNMPVSSSGESYSLSLAELFATRGIATVGIDAPSHGLRGNIVGFFDIEHVPVMRENFREMTFDLLQLGRAIPTLDVDGDAVPDLSSTLGFFGNSLGAIMGASYVALDTHVHHTVLNVPGGGLSNILVSTVNHDAIGLLLANQTNIAFASLEYYSAFPIIRAVAQPFLEPGDPINVLRLMGTDRALMMQMGRGDLTIPNFTTVNLRDSAGVPVIATAVEGTTPVRGFYEIDPARFLSASKLVGYNGHEVFGDIAEVRAQALDFLQSGGTKFTTP